MKDKRIAIFGKGGIGKSTVTSNLSASFARQDMRVLQIGCDPKHDSTVSLTEKSVVPLLELVSKLGSDVSEEQIVTEGKWGVACVEIGGPTPGIGCAGRGIIRGIEILRKLGILEQNYQLVVFDVLGDIVCGGFFDPLKSGGADEMYIVTSGEFNSCYAANNLCRGYLNNFQQYHKAVMAGLIGNCRNIPNEEKLLKEFARAVNLPLLALVPRDSRIEKATRRRRTIFEDDANGDLHQLFDALSQKIAGNAEGILPTPLSHDELEELFSSFDE